jgi:hypothetical protein
LEGKDDGQKTPRGCPDFNSYVKNLHVLVFQTDRQTVRWTDRWTETLIRCGLPSLHFSRLKSPIHPLIVGWGNFFLMS